MLEIKCDNCGSVGKMSLVQEVYEGPYRCWKCRSTFIIRVENSELSYCRPISEEAFEKLLESDDE
jgi:DNA-directed RNA polymerase subunit RPC12/RpoP